jgi:hypothetical protein
MAIPPIHLQQISRENIHGQHANADFRWRKGRARDLMNPDALSQRSARRCADDFNGTGQGCFRGWLAHGLSVFYRVGESMLQQ